MYNNKIVNFQESTTILNTCTKKSGNLLNLPRIFYETEILLNAYKTIFQEFLIPFIYLFIVLIFKFVCVCECIHICVCAHEYNFNQIHTGIKKS